MLGRHDPKTGDKSKLRGVEGWCKGRDVIDVGGQGRGGGTPEKGGHVNVTPRLSWVEPATDLNWRPNYVAAENG